MSQMHEFHSPICLKLYSNIRTMLNRIRSINQHASNYHCKLIHDCKSLAFNLLELQQFVFDAKRDPINPILLAINHQNRVQITYQFPLIIQYQWYFSGVTYAVSFSSPRTRIRNATKCDFKYIHRNTCGNIYCRWLCCAAVVEL